MHEHFDGAKALSQAGLAWLQKAEGLRLSPYDDQTGKPCRQWVAGATIGYGHLISREQWPQYCHGISQGQAGQLLQQDLRPFEKTVLAGVRRALRPHQFDALVGLCFNIGGKAFAGSSVLKLVNDPAAPTSYPDLEAAWKAWSRSQGKTMPGLLRRRSEELAIYLHARYP